MRRHCRHSRGDDGGDEQGDRLCALFVGAVVVQHVALLLRDMADADAVPTAVERAERGEAVVAAIVVGAAATL